MATLHDAAFIMFYIILVGVSNFSVYYMIRNTDGPFDIFKRFRELLGYVYLEVYDDSENVVDIIEEPPTEGFFAKMFDCPWCSSTWYCIFLFVPLYFQYHPLLIVLATCVSISVMNILYGAYQWLDTQMES